MRLDKRVRDEHPELSWARVRQAIERGQVLVDGRVIREIDADVPDDSSIALDVNRPAVRSVRLDLPRLYEDDDILVVDKPAGLLTIPSEPGRKDEDTVLKRVRAYKERLHGGGYVGTLHRLDRGTSGSLAIALSRAAHAAGRELFRAHAFERHYLAIVHGVPARDRGTIDAPISSRYVAGRRRIAGEHEESRPAVTHYIVRETFRRAALLELELETGRQHQIRAHLEYLGYPLAGDRVYADTDAPTGRFRAPRPMLHAWRLAFPHPLTGDTIAVEAPLPDDFKQLLARLR